MCIRDSSHSVLFLSFRVLPDRHPRFPRGVRFGRPEIDLPKDFEKIMVRWKKGELMSKDAIKESGLKYSTFYKKAREYEENRRMKENDR